ncbi:hypothetical protein [Paenarthrobacter ilicis]|uniref:hypothetical protein n=1 Tax=Paenarthrobacter ilicis TaxID=43665 RepID=UPI00386C02D2
MNWLPTSFGRLYGDTWAVRCRAALLTRHYSNIIGGVGMDAEHVAVSIAGE